MAGRALSRDPRNLPDLHHQVVGGDREAFVRAIGDHLDDLYRFVSRELRYREALGDLVPGDRRCGFTYPPACCGGSAKRTHTTVFERLAAYIDGDLDEGDTQEITEHLAECSVCQRRLSELRSVEAAYAGGPEEKPSVAYRETLAEQLRADPGPRRYDLVTVDQIAALKAFYSDRYPVLSLYLDVRPTERQNRKHLAKFRHLVDEALDRPGQPSHRRMRAIQDEVEHLQGWLEYGYDETGEGLAVYACEELGLWRAFRLPVPVPDRLVVDGRPYIRPLVTLTDRGRAWGGSGSVVRARARRCPAAILT